MKSPIAVWKCWDEIIYIYKNFIFLKLTKHHIFPYFISPQFFQLEVSHSYFFFPSEMYFVQRF